MSDEEPKAKNGGDDADSDRAAALARKLAGGRAALSRRNTTGVNPALKPAETSPPASNSAGREAVLAARRASISGDLSKPGAIRPRSIPPPAAAKPRKVRPAFLALGVLVLLVGLIVGAIYVKGMLEDRSPEGRLRNDLLTLEFSVTPEERNAAFAALDGAAPGTVARSIELLTDSTRAERSDSQSERTMQMVAHVYLLHYASTVKAPPPEIANEIVKKLLSGSTPVASDWARARDEWRAWLNEQQSKGVVPKG